MASTPKSAGGRGAPTVSPRVQGGENQVAGHRACMAVRAGLRRSHFANKDRVRVLFAARFEQRGEAFFFVTGFASRRRSGFRPGLSIVTIFRSPESIDRTTAYSVWFAGTGRAQTNRAGLFLDRSCTILKRFCGILQIPQVLRRAGRIEHADDQLLTEHRREPKLIR